LEKAATHRLHELTLTQSGGFQGLATGRDDVFVLKLVGKRDNVFLLWSKRSERVVEIEQKLLRPWLFGRDVERWHIAWDGWYVLFPYVKIGDTYKLIPCKENENIRPFCNYAEQAPRMEEFTKAWDYLNEHREVLSKREGGRFVHDWYGAARPQNLELYEQPKLVLQINSRLPDIAYDAERGFVFQAGGRGGGVYGIALNAERIDPWFALALLNSSVLDYALKHMAFVYTGRTYSYSDSFIKWLPLLVPGVQAKEKLRIAKRLAQLAQELTALKGQLRAKERERVAFPGPQLENLKGRPELYPLSRLVEGDPQARQVSLESVRLQQQLDGSWAMTFGRTTLVFPTEAHARAAEAWLRLQGRASVPSDRLMGLTLPVEERACEALLRLLAETEREIERLRGRLEESEEELDDLVSQLYGLSTADRAAIREFLERF